VIKQSPFFVINIYQGCCFLIIAYWEIIGKCNPSKLVVILSLFFRGICHLIKMRILWLQSEEKRGMGIGNQYWRCWYSLFSEIQLGKSVLKHALNYNTREYSFLNLSFIIIGMLWNLGDSKTGKRGRDGWWLDNKALRARECIHQMYRSPSRWG